MRSGYPLLLALLLAAPLAHAQPVAPCALGTAQAELDVNGVRARLYNKGNLFRDRGNGHYEVPRGSGIHAHFAAGIWIGGMVGGQLRTAAATYASGYEDYEYFPGPLDAEGNPPADCTPYDRIWTVSRTDLARYEGTGVATAALRDWPGHLGAPFFDVDGDGEYDLEAGDRPKIRGDQTAWWVMNDVAGPHLTTLSPPIGLEVRASAFASVSPEPALYYATFYRYEITYRGTAPLEQAYFSLWNDPDLGNYLDDYIGADTTRNLGFIYNGDNNDESSSGGYYSGYGEAPPALGFRFLETPDDLGITVSRTYWSGHPRTGNPDTDWDYYFYMRGLWQDGTPMTIGGDGTNTTGVPTTFLYPNSGTRESPVPGYWSEVCPEPSCSTPIPPNDRRLVVSTGPFRMEPGETEVVTIALVWARGADNFQSVQAMKAASDYVARAYALGALDPVPPPPPELEPGPEALAFGVWPSPFTDGTTVRLAVPEEAPPVRVSVLDALGREVAVLAEGPLAPGLHALPLDGRALAPGLYVVRLEVEGQVRTLPITLVR